MNTELEKVTQCKKSTNNQIIYINLDDSGKLTTKEEICTYGGVVFFSKNEKDKFITQYRKIVNELKCKYCKNTKETCNHKDCPELKSHNLEADDNRRILNYIKKYFVVACIIKNHSVYDHIMENKASRGRYIDYALRRVIKGLVEKIIIENKIDPYKPLTVILNIDEQSTKSNGYYNLRDGLIEELKYGIVNYNYNKVHAPVVFDQLDIKLVYQKSEASYVVQAADLIAGYVRRKCISAIDHPIELDKHLSFIDYKLFIP